ncbi:MAG: hypothetical protein MK078_14705 [Crocinitomicaceae bacterium]|nr:hypothetical protein [Crocinitomicaceae bacterium]
MTQKKKYGLSFITLAFALAIFLIYPVIFGFPSKLIGWDALGYYLYLPQAFIEGDLALSDTAPVLDAIHNYDLAPTLYQAHPVENGNHVIQYTAGLSVLYAVFFFIGHAISGMSDYAADGYSAPYQYAMLAGSYFYMIIGLIYTRKVLLHFFSEQISALAILLICFGTNYYVIHTASHGMPHVYLFTLYAILIWQTIKWHANKRIKNSIILGGILGLMALSRVTEIFAILIPVLYGVNSWKGFKEKIGGFFTKDLKATLGIAVPMILIGSIQLIYWKYTTGHFVYNSYANAGEGLDLHNPHTFNFLFSFRKGWFIYTPLAVLGIYGLTRLKADQRQNWIIGLLAFTIVNTYISSCWSNWWYATSFGQRTMVQSYIVIAIGLGALFTNPPKLKALRHLITTFAVLFLALNLFQSWQYKQGIIHADRMTAQAYFAVFGKTEIPQNFRELLLIDRANPIFDKTKYSESFTVEFNDGEEYTFTDEYGPTIDLPYSEITEKDHAWIKTSVLIKSSVLDNNSLSVTQTFMHGGKNYHDKYLDLNLSLIASSEDTIWTYFENYYLTPEVRFKSDIFRTFIWNSSQSEVTMKNFSIVIFEPTE